MQHARDCIRYPVKKTVKNNVGSGNNGDFRRVYPFVGTCVARRALRRVSGATRQGASSKEVTMKRFRKLLVFLMLVTVSGAGLAACGDMNTSGSSSSGSAGSSSGSGY